jgi:diguanylate cyclase (GGDEF)-like protein
MTVLLPVSPLSLAFYICAGCTFSLAIVGAAVALSIKRPRARLLFSLLALLSFTTTGYQLASAAQFSATSPAAAQAAALWQAGFACLLMPCFVSALTALSRRRQKAPAVISWVLSLLCALVLAAHPALIGYGAASVSVVHINVLGIFPDQGLTLQPQLTPIFWLWCALVFIAISWALVQARTAWLQRRLRLALGFGLFCLCEAALVLICWDEQELIFWRDLAGFPLAVFILWITAHLALESVHQGELLQEGKADLKLQIRERQIAENNVRRMAFEDYLTRLPNRMVVHEHIADLLLHRHNTQFRAAFYVLDLDHFKTINDALGHDFGDEVLRCVGQRLSQHIHTAALIARIGGDEFAIVEEPIEGEPRKQIQLTATRILEIMSEPLHVGDHVLDVSCSIGVVMFPTEADTVIDVVRSADIALYEAKKRQRGSFFVFTPQMRELANERLSLEKGLRHALQKDQLSLFFQPQVDGSGQQVGAEALIRWNNPAQGFISPLKFIRVAEETGLINPIGDWVMQKSLTTLADWIQRGVPFSGSLAINVSTWQFARPDFVRNTQQMISQSGVPPDRVTLEVTESALMADVQEVVNKLNQLRDFGVKIALDDFGTGYSSLAYLRDLPLDTLKIDKSFVDEVETNPHQPLVESMIAIGKHMQLKVVAEGVETQQQLNHLKAMGCHFYQGYFFSKALQKTDFEKWLQKNQVLRNIDSQLR